MGTIRNCGHYIRQRLVVGVAHVWLVGVATDAYVSTITMENIVNNNYEHANSISVIGSKT